MKLRLRLIILVVINLGVNLCEDERSFLENFLPFFRIIKKCSSDALRRNIENPWSRSLLKRNNRQLKIPDGMKFPCNLNIVLRSRQVPRSAHKVRPGDIDVIGALGDSLSAGFGASANSLPEILSEDRGRSFSIGGQDSWSTSLTLPNILKVFNPNLLGYSLRTSITLDEESQFNVAEGGAVSSNLPYMAKVLVKRIREDPRVNMEKHWKMVTLLIGDNDFCSEICYYQNPDIALSKHKHDLLEVLRILRNNLPRTIVNIIPPLHLKLLLQMTDKPPTCKLTHLVECPCLSYLFKNRGKKLFDIMRKWQELDIEVSNYPEFDLVDFTVIPHKYTLEYSLPRTPRGRVDYTYFSLDCFHLSEKGQSRMANNLWNSILEPFGRKSTDGSNTFSVFRCPTEKYPFIFTRRNSG